MLTETELERVTRERDEYWSRLVELGRELLNNDPENPDSHVAHLEREREELRQEIEVLRQQNVKHDDEHRREAEYTQYLREQLRKVASEAREARDYGDKLARELVELRRRESERGYASKHRNRTPVEKLNVPGWVVMNNNEVRDQWQRKKR